MQEIKQFISKNIQNEDIFLTIASGPVIIEDDKVLLTKHGNDDFWKFPGGSVEDSESFQETAKNEAQHKLGIDIEILTPPHIIAFTRKSGEKDEHVVLVHYAAKRIGEIDEKAEAKEFEWFHVNELPKNLAPNISSVVQHFKSN